MPNNLETLNLSTESFIPFSSSFTAQRNNGTNLVRDESSLKTYKTFGPLSDRIVFFAATFIGAILQTAIAAVLYVLTMIALLFQSFMLFLDYSQSFQEKFANIGLSILRLSFILPITVVALDVVAIFGIIFPNNAKKLYTSIETLAYGGPALSHLFVPANPPAPFVPANLPAAVDVD